MSSTQTKFTNTIPAAADLSASQFKLGFIDTSGNFALCGTLGIKVDGVIAGKPTAAGQACEVEWGYTKAVAGAAGIASPGLELTTDALGCLKAAVSTNYVFATSLETAAAGAITAINTFGCGYFKP